MEAMQELRVEIQLSLISLLRVVEQVVEMAAAKFRHLVVQVAEVRMVERLVRMEQLDRVVRVETGLSILDAKVVEEAVEQVLLVEMAHLAQ